jgi:hypothetical protein
MRCSTPYRRAAQGLTLGGLLLSFFLVSGCGHPAAKPQPAGTNVVAGAPTNAPRTNTNAAAIAPTVLSNQFVSVFEDLPMDKGKDPFYPNSARRAPKEEVAVAETNAAPADPNQLKLRGIIYAHQHSEAVINNVIFVEGMTNSVRVPTGPPLTVQCLAIGSNWVKIQVEGQAEPKILPLEEKKY